MASKLGDGEAAFGQPKTDSTPEELGDNDTVLLGDFSRGPGDGMPKRDDVEPYLAALLQAEHLNLLIGSGLTAALAAMAEFDGGADMSARLQIADDECAEAIEEAARLSACRTGRGTPNVEDRLRIAIVTAEGLRNLGDSRVGAVQNSIDATMKDLRDAVSSTEAALERHRDKIVAGQMSLQGVLMSFLGSFAGRTPTRDRLHVFTTNYDRVIEWGAELAGLRIVDRFVGSLRPVFR